jgi:hypothetical protein
MPPQVLTLFEERITAMKESVALEGGDKMETSGTRLLVTSNMSTVSGEDFLHMKKKTGAAEPAIQPDPTLFGIDADE